LLLSDNNARDARRRGRKRNEREKEQSKKGERIRMKRENHK
jgi:hypothetical protein